MTVAIQLLLMLIVLLAPFAVVAALESRPKRGSHLRWFAAPITGRLCEDDADLRRMEHDTDAIRTRFESGR